MFSTLLLMLLWLKTFFELICSCPQMDSELTSHWTDGWRHTHTYTHSTYLMYQLGFKWCLWPFPNVIRERMSIHPHKGHSKEFARGMFAKISSFTLKTSILYRERHILLRFPIKIMAETLQSQDHFANKILQPLFKIKHKLASLVDNRQTAFPFQGPHLFTSSLTLLAVHSQTTGWEN